MQKPPKRTGSASFFFSTAAAAATPPPPLYPIYRLLVRTKLHLFHRHSGRVPKFDLASISFDPSRETDSPASAGESVRASALVAMRRMCSRSHGISKGPDSFSMERIFRVYQQRGRPTFMRVFLRYVTLTTRVRVFQRCFS